MPLLLACFALFSFTANAEEYTTDYLISESSGEYTLTEYEGGTPIQVASGSLAELISYIGENSESAKISLDGISIAESIDFPRGNYTLVGRGEILANARITIPEGTSIRFCDLELTQVSGTLPPVRIKGGSLTIDNSTVTAGSYGATVLDYTPDSTLILNSGRLLSSSDASTVDITNGRFIMLGGSVENTAGVAINNDSSLTLSGNVGISGIGYDITTEKPIALSYGGTGYGGTDKLSVSYLSSFSKGTLTEVFYSTTESAVSNITLYDESGREYPLTAFDTCPHNNEVNFAAVYIPYTVKYYHADGSIFTEYKLYGEKASERSEQERLGYAFSGWYSDAIGGTRYSFSSEVSSDISLYARHTLLAPTFAINSVTVTYDAKSHTLTFDSLEHPLLSEGGFFTYAWMRDGAVISEEATLSYMNVADSGEYSCKITFNYNSDKSEIMAESIVITVNKKEVDLPTVPSVHYNGKSQSPEIAGSTIYTPSDITATDVGAYPVKFTLTDPNNYKWQSTDSESVNVDFEIVISENRFLEDLAISDIFLGASPEPTALSLFGEIKYIYSDSEDGDYSAEIPTALGAYYVKAVVEQTDNYLGISSQPVLFEILPECVSSLSVITPPDKTEYVAFEYFSPVGLSLGVGYNSGRSETVGADKITYIYQSADSFRAMDNGIVLTYGGVSIVLPITVNKADYDLSELDFSDFSLPYDGVYHTYTEALPEIIGKDGIALEMVISGGGINAGEYTVTLSFFSDSQNYNIPKEMTLNMTVNRYKCDVIWQNLTFIYDGREKCPTASYTDVFGITRTLTAVGGQINAGKSYIAKVPEILGNYAFENTEVGFEIQKADFDLSGISWSTGNFVYDNTEKGVFITGLPTGLSVVGYTDATATNAGRYTATASLVYDSTNYNPPPVLSLSWEISPAEYDMSGVEFLSGTFTFDGEKHYPSIIGSMPTGLDGSSPCYTFSNGVTHVSEGVVEVEIHFSTDSNNYNAPTSRTVCISVAPKEITVKWQLDEYTYNGKSQLPTAIADECDLEITGAAVDAGEYTATAVSKNPDYTVTNPTCCFTIAKAANYWVEAPIARDIFEGDALSLSSLAYTGTVICRFYSDPACENEIESPDSAGKYYVIFFVEESKNYLEIATTPLEFSIIPVIPVSLLVEILNNGFVSFDTLCSNDIRATVIYNNGKESSLAFEEIIITYENGSSFRKKDSKVSFTYGDITTDLTVEIGYADYNLSDFLWGTTTFTYDGEAHFPSLLTTPDGVRVTEYLGTENKDAGDYTVTAILSYDTENYNPPPTVKTEFRIEKCIITPESLEALTYNGKGQLPALSSSLYKIESTEHQVNAGEYSVTLVLIDGKNYAFAETLSDTQEVTFEILPLALEASVYDFDLYLYEEVDKVNYSMNLDAIIDGDTVSVEYFIEGDKIYLKSSNPNYTLSFTPGEIIRHNTLSYNARYRLFLICLLLLLLVLLAFILITQKERIKNAYAIVLCRHHNRNVNKNSQNSTKTVQNTRGIGENQNPHSISAPGAEERKNLRSHDLDIAIRETVGPEAEKEDENVPSDSIAEPFGQSGEIPEEFSALRVDAERADELITDSLAKNLVKKRKDIVYTHGRGKGIINVDTLSENFTSGDRVDVNVLKAHNLVAKDTAFIKVLARGSIDKPLSVYANDFSLSAVKMIALTGGEAVKVATEREKTTEENLDKSIEKD